MFLKTFFICYNNFIAEQKGFLDKRNEITGDFICWGRRVVRRCFEKVLRTGERRWFIKKSGMQGKFILSGR